MLKFLFTLIFSLYTAIVLAQAPVITQLDKTQGTVYEVVTIQGSGFGTDTANVEVSFGGILADSIVCISGGSCMLDTEIRVLVPAGATTSSISLTRTDTRQTAYSPEVFYISYDGEVFDRNLMETNNTYRYTTSGSSLYNLCFCDFNQDGLNDIATSDTDSEEITILQNTTPDIDTVAFTDVEINLGENTRWVRCGDLNGDALPELIFSASNSNTDKERLYIYRNTSDIETGIISFEVASPISLSLQGNLAARMVIRDVNMDGKPDITAVDISEDGGVSVFLNNGTGAVISFNPTPSLPFAVFGLSTTELSGIAVEDFNGDGVPDIAVSEDEGSGIYVITNASTAGELGFSSLIELTASGRITNLRAGDLDNDGLTDLVVANDAYVGTLRNTSQDGVISFASPVRFDQTSLGREGLELVDMDGNGLLDIAVAAQNRNWIVLLLNRSTSGSLDFNTKQVILANENSLSVRGGDLNGDGKPDLAYTETATDQIAIQLNRNCLAPVLEPQDGLGICDLLPYQLSVTKAIGVHYEWESSSDGTNFTSVSTDSIFTFTTSDELFYRVKVTTPTYNGLSCTVATSNSVEVVRPDGFVPSKPAIINKNPTEPVCFGGEINLAAESVRADYFWTGPNGFSSSDVSPTITDVTKANEGLYVLFVRASEENGGCVSDTVTTFIRVSEPDSIMARPGSLPVFFEGGQVTLAVNQVDGQTYEWKYNDQVIPGAAETSLTDNREGAYVAVTQNAEGCQRESNTVDVAFARPEIPAELCQNEAGQFVITPERLNGEEIAYRWILEGNRVEGDTVSYQFTNSGTQTVTIEILESDGSVRDRYEQIMEVLATPELTVQAADNPNLCPGAVVVLEASEGFASYQWNTESTERSITVTSAGTYTVTVTAESGCSTSQQFTVNEAENPEGEITASTDRISLGDTLQLQATGGDIYRWNSDISLSDSTIANPFVRPLITTTYVCQIINEAGCIDSVEFTVTVDRRLDVIPERAFTPNNDGNNDTWFIEKMDLYPDCRLTLFNRQGVKLFEQENYSNLQPWDGLANGSIVPPGVYFYLIDCGEEAGTQTGSVTIIR